MSKELAQNTMGQLIGPNAERDAIHIALAPVRAQHQLSPGEHVCADGTPGGGGLAIVGIVDPFLKRNVQPGEWFWLFLYPNTITNLSHRWSHPAFPDVAIIAPDKAASEEWLRNFAATSDCPDYYTLIGAATSGSHLRDYGDDAIYLHFDDLDAHGEIPPEFWDHVEVVTGQKITRRATSFSCSC